MEHAYAQKRAGFLLLSLFPHFNETVIWKGWGLRHILGTSHTSKGNDSGLTQALGFQQSFVLKIWISYLKMLCRQNRLLFRYFSLTSWKYINNLVFVSFGPVCNVLYVPQFIYRLLNSSFISVFFFFSSSERDIMNGAQTHAGLQSVNFPPKSLSDQTQVSSSDPHLTPARCTEPRR